MLIEAIRLAARAIFRNALRSLLTVLGVVIGVGAVIALVTLGNGATQKVTADIGALGTSLLFMRPGQGFGPGTAAAAEFTLRDAAAIAAGVRGLEAVAPTASTVAPAVRGSRNWSATVTGTTAAFLVARDWPLIAGRGFTEAEERAGRAVCILGQTVRRELFGEADPLGERIRLRNVSCEVIGLLAEKGQSSFGQDQDDVVLMPIRGVQRRFIGDADVPSIYLSAAEGVATSKVQRDVTLLMRERRRIGPGDEDDFQVRDMAEIVSTMTATTQVLTGLLSAVAAVSLLVGGIGIMNIMLVSVTERTREIGIRLAIGAGEAQVLTQFLVEAVTLSLLGGLLGILAGLGIAGAASVALSIPFALDLRIIAVAFLFSAAIGVVFGYVPARRAARLDPIEALRHE